MRLHRFYQQQKISGQATITIDDQAIIHQWKNVFRLGRGDSVILFDGSGKEYEAVIEDMSANEAKLTIASEKDCVRIPLPRIHVFASLIKKDKFEWMVEKLTELGVASITPVVSERSQLKNIGVDRLASIAREAAEQSGRGDLPVISEPMLLKGALEIARGTRVCFHGDSEEIFFKDGVSAQEQDVSIFIGPEGGWGSIDLEFLTKNSVSMYSLGELTLRAETAAVAAVSLMRFVR